MGRFVRLYGARPIHLLAVLASFALVGYVVLVAGPATLWNRDIWWHSIIVWFIGAVVLHDFVLYPVYSAIDRFISAAAQRGWAVSPVNYLRLPIMGTALTFVLFFPGIISQGGQAYEAATGLTQEPFLARWLLLTAALFITSALALIIRTSLVRSRA